MSGPVTGRAELDGLDEIAGRLDRAQGLLEAAQLLAGVMQRGGHLDVREAAILAENIRQAAARAEGTLRQVHGRRHDATNGTPRGCAFRLL